MDKKQIMKMNDTWKDFRVNERAILFKPGFAHGFDLAGFIVNSVFVGVGATTCVILVWTLRLVFNTLS